MNREITDVVAISMLFIAGYFISGCGFDVTGCLGTDLEGCYYRADESGEIDLQLDSNCKLLEGTLVVNLGLLRVFSVEGKETRTNIALLNGHNLLNPDSKVSVTVILARDDTLTLQINDEPPLGPLPRSSCPGEAVNGNGVFE